MQFPQSWLRSFCNPPLSTQALADTLTMGGFEVESLRPVAPPFTRIVVGEIKEAVQHPNADRLRVCQVDAGQGALLNIVCGAPNARVGIKVPCALVGAQLPPGEDGKPFVIKTGKLQVNLDTKTVEVDTTRVHLTGKEYQMLELLSLRKGTTLTKEMFLNHLYGGMDEPELKIIDVFICKLRKKLATAAGGKHYIETVWGRGYVLRDPSENAAPMPESAAA